MKVRTPKELSKQTISEMIAELDGIITDQKIVMKKWTTAYINSLPNSSFAVVEPAYTKGKTENKNARHLPFKDGGGNIDLPHLRNALARVNQIKPVTTSISTAELRRKAKARLQAAKKKVGMA